MHPRFTADSSRPGFVVVDPVQRRRFPVTTDRPVDPEPADTDAFRQPVSSAAAVTARRLALPYVVGTFVWEDGEMVAEVHDDEEHRLGAGEYVLDLSPVIKLYVRVAGPLAVRSDGEGTVVEFEEPRRVVVGARSYHERPAGTITVTDDPRDVMRALSHFGSALKTASPERSYPTLRGHPPLVEFGGKFSVPDGIEPPDTGVTIEVPADPEYVLPVASLAYYLGATVEPGSEPRLTTDAGFEYDLARPSDDSPDEHDDTDAFEERVARTLRQVFVLDCAARTDGLYPLDLHERRVLEERLDLDFPALYDASLAERLESYLAVPYADVADQTPTLCLSAHCLPEFEHAAYLPFVADDLGMVRTVTLEETRRDPEFYAEIEAFTRGVERARAAGVTRGASPRSADHSESGVEDVLRSGLDDAIDEAVDYIAVPETDAVEQVWIGDRWPLNAGKFEMAGFRNRLAEAADPNAEDAESVTITVVCNESEMREEYDETLYGNRDELPFEIRSHFDVTVSELREILARRTDFLHYIGHIEESEFVCSDGRLDVEGVDAVGVRAFLLNGCKSMLQGPRMLDAGSVAGIVTLSDVGNRGAIEVGRKIGRLLNQGFSVGSALKVVKQHVLLSNQYVAIGNTRAEICQTRKIATSVPELEANDEGYDLTFARYPSLRQMGGMYTPYLDPVDEYFVISGRQTTFEGLDRDTVESFVDSGSSPIVYDSELSWPESVSL